MRHPPGGVKGETRVPTPIDCANHWYPKGSRVAHCTRDGATQCAEGCKSHMPRNGGKAALDRLADRVKPQPDTTDRPVSPRAALAAVRNKKRGAQ